MFESYGVPAAFLSKDAVLACYACGRTTSIVVDIGASGTVITPVLDGWVESKGISRSIIGGRFMDAYITDLLKNQGVQLVPLFRLSKTLGVDRSLIVQQMDLQHVHPSYDALMKLEL